MFSELFCSFAFSFTSCYNSNVAIQQFECLIVTEISVWISSRETIRFLKLDS